VCEPRNAAVPAAGSSGVPPRERTRSETPRKPAGADACATNTVITSPEEVREKFRRVKPLKDISVTQRGWTLDVLNAIRRLGKTEFSTTDAYVFTRELEKLHPDNRHVRDKIRQQLQVLRDAGLLLHVGRGEWRLP
jgi:type II restriction enzyme